jgi:prepilin-type N-terminal cleavage/methylation domain-containing protein
MRATNAVRRSRAGFSLIEILLVIVIIGILAAIAIPMYLGQRDRAKNASAVGGGRTIMLAVLTYVSENKDEDDPWPGMAVTVDKDFLVDAGAIAASDWPRDAFSGAGEDMRPVEGPGDTTPGRYLYREAPDHATTGRHQIVVYRKDAEPFVIP